MDTWGFIIVAASLVVYFVVRKRVPGLAKLMLYTAGVGTGIVIGAVWAVAIVNRYIP